MPNTVLIGAQWGDEGKGKIIDVITEAADWVVRYQGGNNAGHTVEIGDEKYVLHLLPSGILHPGKKCVIGNGLVVDPVALNEELQGLIERGVQPTGRLFISDRSHMVVRYHRVQDESKERRLVKGEKIGTTKRGIGPAYADKANRTGLRMSDCLSSDFRDRLKKRIEVNNRIIEALEGDPLEVDEVLEECVRAVETLKPYITDTIPLLNEALCSNQNILFEGAQGTMLDIDFGTYPFVTSSSATSGGAVTGSGVPPHRIDRVLGVIKAYTTRVGEGPFPTELFDETGDLLRDRGGEYGATTGRPRRCGWYDAVVARYSAMLNGVNYWALTKLDVLDECEVIRVCTAYEYKGELLTTVPADAAILEQCTPVYEEVEGWNCKTGDVQHYDDLPKKARDYIAFIERLSGVPVGIISVGPKRSATMVRMEL